jgi:hypothetical protein
VSKDSLGIGGGMVRIMLLSSERLAERRVLEKVGDYR